MIRYGGVAVAAFVLFAGNAECENVDTCTPTRTEISRAGDGSYEVALLSGDQPLRGKDLRIQAIDGDEARFTRDVTLDRRGAARVTVPADALVQADDVVATFAGDRNYCPSTNSAGTTPGATRGK